MTKRIDVLDKGFVELVDYMGSDVRVASAARVIPVDDDRGDKDTKLINYMAENFHTSPFEHVVFTFLIKCPLFVARQWHRHRTWSYNEVSRRYTSENMEFYYPKEWRMQSKSNRQVGDLPAPNDVSWDMGYELFSVVSHAITTYNKMLSTGIAREMARMVLPQNMYTTFYGTVDFHNLRHFITLRSSKEAQWEIRQYSDAMKELIKDIVPRSMEAWNVK